MDIHNKLVLIRFGLLDNHKISEAKKLRVINIVFRF